VEGSGASFNTQQLPLHLAPFGSNAEKKQGARLPCLLWLPPPPIGRGNRHGWETTSRQLKGLLLPIRGAFRLVINCIQEPMDLRDGKDQGKVTETTGPTQQQA